MSAYPLMLEGSSLFAVVVGGGTVAVRKVRALLETGARVRVVAPEIALEIRDWAATNAVLEILDDLYSVSHLAGATLVIAATNDASVNARVASDARAEGKLVNVVSDSERGNCSTPAVHRVGDIVIAISTGRVPSAAARIRDVIAGRIDTRYAGAVRELSSIRSALLDSGRRDRWHQAAASLAGPAFCDEVEAGRFDSRLAEWR